MSRVSRRMVFFLSLFALFGGKQVGAASIFCLRYRDLPLILPPTVCFIFHYQTTFVCSPVLNFWAHTWTWTPTNNLPDSTAVTVFLMNPTLTQAFPEQSSEAVSWFQLVCSRNPDRPNYHHNIKKAQLLFSPTSRRSSLQTWFELTFRMNTSPTWS